MRSENEVSGLFSSFASYNYDGRSASSPPDSNPLSGFYPERQHLECDMVVKKYLLLILDPDRIVFI